MTKKLTPVDWSTVADISVIDQESAVWPPLAVRSRLTRLAEYYKLFDGDLSPLTDYGSPVVVNYFQRICSGLADILTFSPPTTGDEDTDSWLPDVAYDMVVDMLRYGAAILHVVDYAPEDATEDDETMPAVDVLDPRNFVPMRGGWAYTVYYVEPTTGEDRMTILTWHESDGLLMVYDSQAGTLSGATLVDIVEQPDPGIFVVPRTPRRDNGSWGTSVFDIMADPTTEISNRYGRASHVLDVHASPLLTYRIANSDLDELDEDIDLDDDSFVEQAEKAAKVLDDATETGQFALPDFIQSLEYVTWDGSLGEAFTQIEMMRSEMETLTSTVGLFGREGMNPSSGVALKFELLQLFIGSQSLQNTARKGLERALAAEGLQVTWEHAFDVLGAVAQASQDAGDDETGPEPDDEEDGADDDFED